MEHLSTHMTKPRTNQDMYDFIMMVITFTNSAGSPDYCSLHHVNCLSINYFRREKRKRVIDFLPISVYEGNEYRLIATKKNRIGYFD